MPAIVISLDLRVATDCRRLLAVLPLGFNSDEYKDCLAMSRKFLSLLGGEFPRVDRGATRMGRSMALDRFGSIHNVHTMAPGVALA